jgi:predicted RNase H-like HicB family nuclease
MALTLKRESTSILSIAEEIDVTWPDLRPREIVQVAGPFVADLVHGIPESLLRPYAKSAVSHSIVERTEDGEWFASVVGLSGVWGLGIDPDSARHDLEQSICLWAALKRSRGVYVPPMDGWDLNPVSAGEPTS